MQPGDQVTIEFINGCRETPCILAPEDIREVPDTTLPTGEGVIFISYSNENQSGPSYLVYQITEAN